MPIKTSLKDLPVRPTLTGDEVRGGYVAELKAVTTPAELWAFAMRWRPLFLLTRKRKIDRKAKDAKRFRLTQKNMQALISMDWKPEGVFECVQSSREGVCKHASQFSCVGMHILLPEILLQADFVAKHYGVGSDLALIQMNGGQERLDGP
jgi:hypothetical protein